MPRQRVVIDVTAALYPSTGIGRSTRELVRAIARLAPPHEIVLFGRRLWGTESIHEFGLRGIRVRLPRVFERLFRMTRAIELLTRGCLYHATDHYLPTGRGALTVATVHDTMFLARPETHIPDHARMARWAPAFARRCRRVITCSQHSKRDIVEHLDVEPDRVVVIPWGLNASFHPAPHPQEIAGRLRDRLGLLRPYFLSVSCSSGRKNTPMLLQAYERLLRSDPARDLVLVWDAPREIRERHHSQRIHFLGRQSEEELLRLYQGASVFIFPSLYEGFGLPVLEAMGCGVPVLCSSAASLPEVGGDAATYFDAEDVDSLVAAMENVERGRTGLSAQRASGLVQAARFSWERCAIETVRVYERCLQE